MIDWHSSMKQSFEYYIVDPNTWKDDKPINEITMCTIDRDSSNATRGSASIDATKPLDECYVRTYLVAVQNGITERFALGTHLVQTPSEDFNGKVSSISMDAYTPLIELKGTPTPVGYSILKGENIMDAGVALCRENMRAPVVQVKSDKVLEKDFVSNLDDNWLSYLTDLCGSANYNLDLDEMGRVIFQPVQNMAALQPVWTFDDGNSSILYPDISNKRDLYDIPNVVEVVYSTAAGYKTARVVNDDPSSPISTVNRGWTKTHRDTNPNFSGLPTQQMIDDYAEQLLRSLSSLEHTITFTHGYCPVRVGDCVMMDYKRASITNTKAKIISQSIECSTGCSVKTTAVYTTNLWR